MSKRKREAGSDSAAKRDFLTHLSVDLVLEICSRLPMKKLVQCMSVSKAWHSIIHHTFSTQAYLRHSPGVLVVQHKGSFYYSSLGQVHEAVQFSKPYNFKGLQQFTDMVKGLVCAYNSEHVFVCNVWSGEIMKLPDFPGVQSHFDYFFGFDPINGLYKLLAMKNRSDELDGSFCHYILTLEGTNGSWRELDSSSNMPKPFGYVQTHMVDGVFRVDGVLYWLKNRREIIGFNLSQEKFMFIHPPKMDESRFCLCKFTQFKGRLAIYYAAAHKILIIHTLDDEKGISWIKNEIIYPDELKCRLRTRIVPLPSGDILLANGETQGCVTSTYSYNYRNDKFEKFVVGKWPMSPDYAYDTEKGGRLARVCISCEVPNFERIFM